MNQKDYQRYLEEEEMYSGKSKKAKDVWEKPRKKSKIKKFKDI
jgi:hypothetical protein